MKISVEQKNQVSLVSLAGRFDASVAEEFKESMAALIDQGCSQYVIDLSMVSYVDSSGLGCLVSSLRQVRDKNDGDIRMAELSSKAQLAFELTRLHRVFEIFDDCEAAILSYQED